MFFRGFYQILRGKEFSALFYYFLLRKCINEENRFFEAKQIKQYPKPASGERQQHQLVTPLGQPVLLLDFKLKTLSCFKFENRGN